MQLNLLLLGLATAAMAMPAPSSGDNAVETQDDTHITRNTRITSPPIDTPEDDTHITRDTHITSTSDHDDFHKEDTSLTARAPPTKWEASGGCRTDWGGKCLNKCKAEAKEKGQTCKLGSNIWKSDCWLGWSVCTCYCKR